MEEPTYMKSFLTVLFSYVLTATALTVPVPNLAEPASPSKSPEEEIASLAATFGGRIGVAAKDLATGKMILVNADSLFPTASAIKLPVLVTLFEKFHEGVLHPTDTIFLTDSTKYGGSGILQFYEDGAALKLIDAAMLMIVLSDNTATNLVLDTFARDHDEKLAAVNSLMDRLGLHHTRILNKLMSWATKKKTPESIRYGVGYSTPNDMMHLLELLATRKLVDEKSSEQMIDMLKKQQDITMAPRYLPYDSLKSGEQITVANKTGWVSQSKIDVGIVYGPKTTYVYAIFADNSRDTSETVDNKAVLAVARASRILYDAFTQE